ncbi:MAG: c-type cytochrome domain-containing protein [Limisphaerales bacterium]
MTISAAETNSISAGEKILFDRDVRPIFEQSCFRCHGPEKPKSDFRLDLRAEALQGGDDNTNDIVPGHSGQSCLIRYVSGADEDIQMPPPDRGHPLTPAQVATLRDWIDQGANWGTNSTPSLAFSIEPELGWIGVQGDKKKFRELEGVPGGFGGGAENFSMSEQISPDEKFTVAGHALLPENDFKLSLALDKNNVGFVHSGFEEWRKYFDDTGGFYPGFTPSSFSLNRDLHEDIGRAWIDFGLTLPNSPQLVFGYEYQFRQGAESTLAWGTVNQGGIAKNIFPDEEIVNEHTHIFKVDLTDDWNGWDIQDHARVEVYRLGESRNDVTAYSAGPTPDVIERADQSVHYTLGANTFRVEKQITDWWLASFGSLLSRYDGTSSFNQNAVDGTGAPTFGSYWNAQGITLRRDSKVVSVASSFLPMKGLSISAGAQGEWTGESGLGNVNLDFGDPAIPGSFFPFPGTVNANQNRTEFSENVDALFTRLPRTVLFADARLQQESVGQFDGADNTLEPFQERTDALNHLYDASAGFTSSPWTWIEFGGHYRRRDSSTGYNHLVDESPLGGDGYPAFIRHRDISMDEIAGEISLRPVFWFNARLTYDWDLTDFSSATDPVNDAFLGLISPGGEIFDGRTESHNFGLNVTFTPISRFYFSGSFTYGYSRTTTTSAASPEVAPYFGNTYTIGASAGWALNAKTDLNAAYNFSQATYGQNNTAGIPLGLDFTRHELLVSLTRQLTKRLTGALHYQFSQYAEPSGGNMNNFIAHSVFATLTYKWP